MFQDHNTVPEVDEVIFSPLVTFILIEQWRHLLGKKIIPTPVIKQPPHIQYSRIPTNREHHGINYDQDAGLLCTFITLIIRI